MNFYDTKEFECLILSHLILVKFEDEIWTEDTMGIANLAHQKILINENLKDDAKLTTFWHEAIHIIEHTLGLKLTEQQVDGISTGVFSILRDNPRLIEAMLK